MKFITDTTLRDELFKLALYFMVRDSIGNTPDEDEENVLARIFYSSNVYTEPDSMDDLITETIDKFIELESSIEDLSGGDEDLVLQMMDSNVLKSFLENFKAASDQAINEAMFELYSGALRIVGLDNENGKMMSKIIDELDVESSFISGIKDIILELTKLENKVLELIKEEEN